MSKKRFLYFFGVIFSLAMLFLPVDRVVAGEGSIVFEIPDSAINFLESWNYKIAQKYIPPANQTVCSVEHSVSTGDTSLSNSLILSVYLINEGLVPKPETGTKIAETSVLNVSISKITPSYVSMRVDPCLNLLAGRIYFFVWIRNPLTIPLPLPITYNYYSLGSTRDVSPLTSYWKFDQFTWYENVGQEWSFRIRGPAPQLKEPVIIIPGTMGSRLNRASDGEEVWPNVGKMFIPGSDEYLNDLKLNDDGITDANTPISVGTIVDKVGLFGMYSQLIEKFVSAGYVLNRDLFIVTYDWRKDIASNNQVLDDKVQVALVSSLTGKVNLVGHSMGAMLLRDYLSKQPNLDFIDNAVFVAPSFLGGPETFKVFNYGDDLDFNFFGLGLNPQKTKDIAQNMPGIYELLPPVSYFDKVGGYVADFRNGAHSILSYDETNAFMLSDSQLPDYRSPQLLEQANQFHQRFDNTNLDRPHIYNIVGCGISTMGGFRLYDKGKIDISYVKGDGTVPLVSADHFADQGMTYYVLPTVYKNHLNLTQNPIPQQLIADLVANQDPGSPVGVTHNQNECRTSSKKNLLVATFSPVDLHIYDSQGNHTGLKPDGDTELGIPDSDFFQLGENNFISLPEGGIYRAMIDAYASGSFDLKIREIDGEQITQSANFLNIPITSSNLVGELDVSGFDDLQLNLDSDGDGEVDQIISPTNNLLGTLNNDVTPPTIGILSPSSPSYTRAQVSAVNTDITDQESGVGISFNKLDGAVVASESIDLFYFHLGSHSFEVMAYDKAGNLSSKLFRFRSTATIESTIFDINRCYALGWVTKESVKNSLIRRISRPVNVGLLKELDREYNRGSINQSAHDILREDILWLMSHKII